MSRHSNQSAVWDFQVVPTRLNLPSGKPSSIWANVRTDTDEAVGVVSEKGYGLIQNGDFVNTIRQALNGLGLTGYQESILTTTGGSKLYATYSFDQRVKTLSKVGDQVGLVLRFANSFDGKLAAMGELRAKILRCLNGAMLEKGEFKLQKRHNPKISLDFVQDVTAKAVNDFDRALAVFDRLAEVPVTDEQGLNLLKRAPVSQKTREGIGRIWITPSFAESRARTLYALYDAATEYLRDLEATRFELTARVNRIILRNIVRAIDPEQFAVITSPVVVQADAVVSESLDPAESVEVVTV